MQPFLLLQELEALRENVRALIGSTPTLLVVEHWISSVESCVLPGLFYFISRISLHDPLEVAHC